MSIRPPFILPDECKDKTSISFDINIFPPDFALCSLPSFVDPDPDKYGPPVIIPPVFPPECVCFPNVVHTPESKIQVGTPKLDITIKQVNADCCDPDIKLSYDFNLPNMWKQIEIKSAITRATPGDLTFDSAVVDLGDIIRLSLNINIPCICFPSVSTINKKNILFKEIPKSEAALDIKLTQINDDCCDPEIKVDMSMDLPCFPLTITTEVTREIETAAAATAKLDIKLAKIADCEGIEFSYDFQIPCYPKAVSVQEAEFAGYKEGGGPRLDLKLIKTEDCGGIKISYNLEMPCLPNGVTTETDVTKLDDPEDDPTIDVTVTKQLGCFQHFKFNFGFPPARPCIEMTLAKISGTDVKATYIHYSGLPECNITFGPQVQLCEGESNTLELQLGVQLKLPGGMDSEIDVVTNVFWADNCLKKETTKYRIVKGRIGEALGTTKETLICGEECPT